MKEMMPEISEINKGWVDNHKRDKHTLADAYRYYKKNTLPGSIYSIDQTTYSKICRSFNKKSIDYVIKDFGTIHKPCRLGALEVTKSKRKAVDKRRSYREGKTIYYTNEHTKGYTMRFRWNKTFFMSTMKTLYGFRATWSVKKQLNKFIENNPKLCLSYREIISH
tara:strand:+ start:1181 stop:1675 length:495 start_codon:yes stop_codon:yes gene_type:complete